MNNRVMLIRLAQSEKVRFLLAGCANTVFGFPVFTGFYLLLTPYFIHYLVIVFISQVISITSAFFVYKKFVFQSKSNPFQEYIRFVSVYLFGLFLNIVLMITLVDFVKIDALLSQGIATMLIIVLSYVGHRKYSFKVS